MTLTELGVLVTAIGIVCVLKWRTGFLLVLVMGLLADPIRKIVPGEPVHVNTIPIVLAVATLVGYAWSGHPVSFRGIVGWTRHLRLPLFLFVSWVVLQAALTVVRTGSVVLAGIGLMAYVVPFLGILLAYEYARSDLPISRYLRLHVALVLLMASGIYLARSGFDFRLLESVGTGLIAYSPGGEQLELLSGFFRSPEVAAWHLAMAICFLFVLYAAGRRLVAFRWMNVILAVYLGGALLFTGRRKAIAEVVVFLLVYVACQAYFRRGAVKSAAALAVAGITAVVVVAFTDLGTTLGIEPYYERSIVFGSAEAGRYRSMTIDAARWVIEQNGFFGAGAGMGSQGAQHFGGGSAIIGSAAEGGLAKVLAELGVPGLLLFLWLIVVGAARLWSVVRSTVRADPVLAGYAYGFVGLLLANVSAYVIAHQVFGDPFVLFLIGSIVGFLFAAFRMMEEPLDEFPVAADPVRTAESTIR